MLTAVVLHKDSVGFNLMGMTSLVSPKSHRRAKVGSMAVSWFVNQRSLIISATIAKVSKHIFWSVWLPMAN